MNIIKNQIVYKVVIRYSDNSLLSVISHSSVGIKRAIIYKENEIIYPKGGYIFAFKDLKNAKKFIQYTCLRKGTFLIYECIANVVDTEKVYYFPYIQDLSEVSYKSLKHILLGECQKTVEDESIERAPEGTVLCTSIKLLKRVF